jgi:hypothetical protein
MNRRILSVLVGVIAVALIVAVYGYLRAPGNGEVKTLDLLTILGDVSARPPDLPGRWRPALDGTMRPLTLEERERLEGLEALPYAGGSVAAPGVANVTIYDPDLAYDGLNLYTSGHAPEATLIDMQGKVLHRWSYPIDKVWPGVPYTIHSTFWRRAHLYPNGDLLAIFEGIGILKLDAESNLIWAYGGAAHHEAFVTENGDIYVLTRRGQLVDRINPDQPVLLDAITVLSPRGRIKRLVSILEAFERSEYHHLLRGLRRIGDILHTNSVHVLDGSLAHLSPVFKKGNVLTSLFKPDVVAIVDMDAGTVVWARSGRPGRWRNQHDPKLLDSGNMLLFDNLGRDGRSRVVEFDPDTLEFVWEYPGGSGRDLYSKTCGTNDRLPNGNTLITESDNGRALEVTPDKTIVWEFLNPHRAGENDELIATLFELTRIERDFVEWLELDRHSP